MGRNSRSAAGGLSGGQLHVEVGLAGLGEGALIDDAHAAGVGLGLEVVPDADGILVVVLVDDGDFGIGEVLIDILRGAEPWLESVKQIWNTLSLFSMTSSPEAEG